MKEVISIPSRIGRSALAFTMAAAIAMPAVALTAPAYADTGSVTVTAKDNAGAKYKVYRLFTADIYTDIDGNDMAQSIAWNDTYKADVLAFLDSSENGAGHDYTAWRTVNGPGTTASDKENPQNAAEYIADMIRGSLSDYDANTSPPTIKDGEFAMKLAQVLSEKTATGQATAGTAYEDVEGFYLFVSDGATVGAGEAGTAPIWVPLGGSTTTITEKTSVPTVTKQVKEDSTGEYGNAADANQAQELDYKLTASLPANIGAFETYHLKFTDTLPSTMAMKDGDTSSVVVKVGDLDVTNLAAFVSVALYDNVLTVDIANLKDLPYAGNINKDTKVTVEYKAHMTTSAAIGSVGNENEVSLTYTEDPVSLIDQDGGVSSTVKTYTYQLSLVKTDKQTGEALDGAKFTIQVANIPAGQPTYEADAEGTHYKKTDAVEYIEISAYDALSPEEQANYDATAKYKQVAGSPAVTNPDSGKYVQADGSLGATAYEFTTAAGGKITVPRIDEGTYTIHETSAPVGYKPQTADMTVTISSEFTAAGALDSLTATVSGGEPPSGTDVATHVATSGDSAGYGVTAPSATTGIVGLVTSDPKEIFLPITGMEGTTALVLGAAAAIAIGGVALALTRKREDDGEEA